MKKIPLCILALLFFLGLQAHAQVQINIKMSRTLYMLYEPTLVQVSITNLSGRDLNLEDRPGHPWFSFEIYAGPNNLIPPTNPDYHLEALYIPTGKTVKRTINLIPLYSLQEFGAHSVQAIIYDRANDRYFSSNRIAIEITEGRLMWSQTVGSPDDGATLTYSLLNHRLPNENRLYVRIADQKNARVIACFSTGRMVDFSPPTEQIDSLNQLHILQMIGPKNFYYTCVGMDGQIVAREGYTSGKSDPRLVREESGMVTVKGGKLDVPVSPAQKVKVPKLSDRPVALPR